MAAPQEQPSVQALSFMDRLPIPNDTNPAALSRVLERLSAVLPQQTAATSNGSFTDRPKALASQHSVNALSRPGTAYLSRSLLKTQTLPRGRSSSVDRQRLSRTSPVRLFSSARRSSEARARGREDLDATRDDQMRSLRRKCEATTARCRELEEALSERNGEISSLKARNAKLRSEKANEKMKRQLSAVDQVLHHEDAAGARLEGPGFGKDHRLALLIKKVKSLEESREEALAVAERAQAASASVKEALETKTREYEELEKEHEAHVKELGREKHAREKLEAHLHKEVEVRNQMQAELDHRQSEFERVCADVDSLRASRAELLERTVKRDRAVDTWQKKAKSLAEALEAEQKARAKAEDEIANLEDRMRTIRKRSVAFEVRLAQEKEQRNALLRDVKMKEEECCLLVKMVSNPLTPSVRANGLSDADTIAEQSERIKILLSEVSRLRFASQQKPASPEPSTVEMTRAALFENGDWEPTLASKSTTSLPTRGKLSRLPSDSVEAAARLARRRRSSKKANSQALTDAFDEAFALEKDQTQEKSRDLERTIDQGFNEATSSGNGKIPRDEKAGDKGTLERSRVSRSIELSSDESESEWEEAGEEVIEEDDTESHVPIVQVVLASAQAGGAKDSV